MRPKLVLLLGVMGCGSSPLSPAEIRELVIAEARWEAQGPKHYTLEVRRGCFCPPEVSDWGRIEVDADTLVSVVLLDGTPVPPQSWYARPPVPAIFEEIESTDRDWLDDISARYDPVTGVPVRVSFKANDNVLDAGFVIETRNLVSLDP